ncbi:uncharacterized protein A1O5_10814 [Cladophialophora psammophila CBS 110553]|uniref:NmrA-like domain-containing protein n=1 Tax=Cladophialophora psammophila CBS 110553 TaxID=1182543 RepID=W9WE14_9EURO|nr:uncharacterized protein A1O5_10814 [Cladophialophora psammophila CBS 110553]EXJ66198.1 hypothetical protein A1O5_10814 [Cladophialophora psammophila CBS 110553]
MLLTWDRDGPNLNHAAIRDELYFADKLALRKHIEARVQADTSLGFTYVMTGALSDFLLESNVLGLNEDKRSAIYFGSPDARVSTTHSDDIAKFVVASLLPHHLPCLNARRHLCFAGSTLSNLSLFDAVSYVLRRPLDVTYDSLDISYENESQLKAAGDKFQRSFRRILGCGGFELKEQEVAQSGREFWHEVKPKAWAQVVYEFFTSKERGWEMIK